MDYIGDAVFTFSYDDGKCWNRARTIELDIAFIKKYLPQFQLEFDLKLCEECDRVFLCPSHFHYEEQREVKIDTPVGVISIATGLCERCR